MAKKASQRGTGNAGEKRYRKGTGGPQGVYLHGGPGEVREARREARREAQQYIAHLRQFGRLLWQGTLGDVRYGDSSEKYTSGVYIQVWEYNGVDYIVIPEDSRYTSWSDAVLAMGLKGHPGTKRFSPRAVDQAPNPLGYMQGVAWKELNRAQRVEKLKIDYFQRRATAGPAQKPKPTRVRELSPDEKERAERQARREEVKRDLAAKKEAAYQTALEAYVEKLTRPE